MMNEQITLRGKFSDLEADEMQILDGTLHEEKHLPPHLATSSIPEKVRAANYTYLGKGS